MPLDADQQAQVTAAIAAALAPLSDQITALASQVAHFEAPAAPDLSAYVTGADIGAELAKYASREDVAHLAAEVSGLSDPTPDMEAKRFRAWGERVFGKWFPAERPDDHELPDA